MADSPSVVLVHGAFADASGYAGVIRELESSGITVYAPANPLRSLTIDADSIAAFVSAIPGPVVLVGHSYGGAVITQAGDLPNVTGLVYIAAFGLDVGESALSVQEPFPPSALATSARPTAYDAVGSPGGPEIYIDRAQFVETFCADLPADQAAVMAVAQRAIAAASLGEPATKAAWKSKPSWFLVATQDHAINPDAERFMAKRMNATTIEVEASHVVFISQPKATADLIRAAIAG